MKTFPKDPTEWNRTWMRVTIAFLVLNAGVFLGLRHLADADWVCVSGQWSATHSWEYVALVWLTIISAGLMVWSLFLLVGSVEFRDLRYGLTGLAIGLAALALWLLWDKAIPR
jgi:hypothetical protein